MKSGLNANPSGWQRLDKAAFGIIYGAIMVLSILMAAGDHPEAPMVHFPHVLNPQEFLL